MQLVCEGHLQIESFSQGLRLVLNRPTILEEPVLQGESDADASGTSIAGSVIKDGGAFRMWYLAWPRDWDGSDVVSVGCVESDDGLNWRRPSYGLMESCGTRENHLTDLPFHCPSVMIDPDADSSARYRAFGYTTPEKMGSKYAQKVSSLGYYTAHSADGLHWEVDSPDPVWPYGDVITGVWDPYSGCARIALRRDLRLRGMQRRAFRTATWAAGEASQPVTALVPDEYDDLTAQQRGFASADYYGVGQMPTEGPTIGFLWNFRHQLPLHYYDPMTFHVGGPGRVDLSIVYQIEREGRWLHVPGRPDWLCADEAPDWARGALYTASSPLDVGDETWLYFTGTKSRHGWCGRGTDYSTLIKTASDDSGLAKIGLAKWAKNRIMGLESTLTDVITLLPSKTAEGQGKLVLNVVARPGGRVRAQLLDADGKAIPGYGLEDCEVLSGDHLEGAVRWRGKAGLPQVAEGQPLRAQLEISSGTLYAFDFAAAE